MTKVAKLDESLVDNEPLIKRVRSSVPTEKTTEKTMPTIIETEKTTDVPIVLAPEKGTTEKIFAKRLKKRKPQS